MIIMKTKFIIKVFTWLSSIVCFKFVCDVSNMTLILMKCFDNSVEKTLLIKAPPSWYFKWFLINFYLRLFSTHSKRWSWISLQKEDTSSTFNKIPAHNGCHSSSRTIVGDNFLIISTLSCNKEWTVDRFRIKESCTPMSTTSTNVNSTTLTLLSKIKFQMIFLKIIRTWLRWTEIRIKWSISNWLIKS